jgi:DNA polymerase-3 subunit alpha
MVEPSSFVHLHNHSELSRLDGAVKIKDMVARVKALGQKAVALTDHGHSFGAMKLWRECKAQGIKPIIGAELYIAPDDMYSRGKVSWGEIEDNGRIRSVPGGYTHLTVLAQNATGLRNLYKLHERGYLEGYYSYPRVDLRTLAELGDGLIVLSGCAGSAISTRLRLNQIDEAYAAAAYLADSFPGRFYIEVMHHGIDFEDELNASLSALAHILSLPVVLTNDCHYGREEDASVHDAVLCIQTGARLSDENRFKFTGSGFYLKSAEQMSAVSVATADAIANTVRIADSVESYDEVFEHQDLMPKAAGKQSLFWAVTRGLRDRGLFSSATHLDRAGRETRVLEDLGYDGYILAIADIVRWAKSQGILVGPARGSAGGSLVCYALGITGIDPIEHGLIFERFLNPARVSAPDVDIDFDKERRDEVFQYAIETYGKEHVGKILTYVRIGSRNALKDAARLLGLSPREAQRLANLVPDPKRGRTMELADVPELARENPEVIRLAMGLENMVRGYGKHAAGLAISSRALSEVIPVKKDASDKIMMTGFENDELESLGIIKIDCLGLENLTTIQKTLGFING